MNKKQCLAMIKARFKVLERRYGLACGCYDDQGKEISKSLAGAIRAQCKRDMQLLMLTEYCIMEAGSNFFLEIGTDEYDGFMRLVEPLERFRNKR